MLKPLQRISTLTCWRVTFNLSTRCVVFTIYTFGR
jgi:hypothetical protein